MIPSMVVFLPSGAGLTFKEVEILVDDVNLFIFTYASRSDGVRRKAKLYTKNIVGHSEEEMPAQVAEGYTGGLMAGGVLGGIGVPHPYPGRLPDEGSPSVLDQAKVQAAGGQRGGGTGGKG